MSTASNSLDSTTSSDSSDNNEVNQNRLSDYQWEAQITEENIEVDQMLENYFISNITQFVQPPNRTPRNRRQYIERNREAGHERLFNDYFSENSVYNPEQFRRRFRMRKHLFMRLVDTISGNNQYFQQRAQGNGRLGFSALQKCTAALRVLAYGSSADSIDEYMRMSETVVRDSVRHFVRGVTSNFGDQYLRRPNQQDLTRLLQEGQRRGFPGMLGSIDCMHWEWKNCPTAWAGQYAGRNTKTTIILEAVASYDLWIWHAYFGTPGSQNDINVLQRSPVFNDILEGRAPEINFTVNGNEYNMGYYLTDGIYPCWATFVKSIPAPQIYKHRLFAARQESVRKDVERAFGVLQARFAFIKRPCLLWDHELMGEILMACIIMHNMIVEDERDSYQRYGDIIAEFHGDLPTQADDNPFEYQRQRSSQTQFVQIHQAIRSRDTHANLKNDLIEHIWENFRTV